MSRSKKNYDWLVGENGLFLDKGEFGQKGDKGQKGQAAPTFIYQGNVSTTGDLPASPPAEPGWIYKIDYDSSFWGFGEQSGWVELPGLQEIKGEKGEKGNVDDFYTKGEVTTILDDYYLKVETFNQQEVLDLLSNQDVALKGDMYLKTEVDDILTQNYYTKDETYNKGEAYNRTEVDNILLDYYQKTEVYNKGEIAAILSDYYTQGEIAVILDDYYLKTETWTKGEAYNKPEVDGLLTDYYDKGEVDSLLQAAEGTTYSFTARPAGANTGALDLTDSKGNTVQTVKFSAPSDIGLAVKGDTVEIGGSFTKPLQFLGPIAPPTDPNILRPDPPDGGFFIYTDSGTAWNGEEVEAGYWVIYDDHINPGQSDHWANILIGVDSGVTAVSVAGGLLTDEGTETNPVISLTVSDLVSALKGEYLLRDGNNAFTGNKLQFNPATPGSRVNFNRNGDDGFAFTIGNSYKLSISGSLVNSATNVRISNNKELQFAQGNGAKINVIGGNWGTLASDGVDQVEWGIKGVAIHGELSLGGSGTRERIIHLADPINAQDAATKKYVDDNAGSVLTPATTTQLGGVIVGSNIDVDVDGKISVNSSTFKGQKGLKGQQGAAGSSVTGPKGQKGAAGSSGSSGTYVQAGTSGITITKSGSNYFISGG